MGKVAFIYPGQGSQKAFMGEDFYEQCDMAKKYMIWQIRCWISM